MQNLISEEPRRNGARALGELLNRAALVIALAVAIIAAAVALDLPSAAAQSEEQAGRIVAQRLADGRTEFGWQPASGARVLPSARYFPTDAEVGRWLNSSPVEVEGEAIGRINARLNADGRIEFAFTPTDRERILTDARYFPAAPRPNRWLRSTKITIGPPQLDDPFIALHNHYERDTRCGLRESGAIECWDQSHGEPDTREGSFIAIASGCAIAETFESATSGTTASGVIECWEVGVSDPPAGRFTAVGSNSYHSCAIRAGSGAIECWGSNGWGQGTPPAGSFTAVSTGNEYTCGLRESGAIECWGLNDDGELNAPTGSFSAVSAGAAHACAIRAESGAIECWGDNRQGQADAPEGSFTAVAPANYHSCAIRAGSGAIECWGLNNFRQSDPPAGRFSAVSAGYMHACGLRTSGAIECWGDEYIYGQTNAPAP